jgi:hypothetical protein
LYFDSLNIFAAKFGVFFTQNKIKLCNKNVNITLVFRKAPIFCQKVPEMVNHNIGPQISSTSSLLEKAATFAANHLSAVKELPEWEDVKKDARNRFYRNSIAAENFSDKFSSSNFGQNSAQNQQSPML